jgi:site-specific DNA-methyltransferase (cytosine-N4-specific)
LPSKNLVGIPWRVALALQADGWYLRSDIIWSKPNPMPESVTDRPTKSHEYLFLMSKNERYYYDNEAIKEPCADDTEARYERGRSDKHKWADGGPGNQTIAKSFDHMKKIGNKKRKSAGDKRNKRDVWVVPTQPFRGSHFATFPPALIEPCILAGSRPGDIVLDPFFGSGTTGQVAEQLGRQWIGCEIQRDYEPLQKKRTRQKGLVL